MFIGLPDALMGPVNQPTGRLERAPETKERSVLTINQLAILLLAVSFAFVVHVIASLWLHVKLDARVKKLEAHAAERSRS